MVYWRILGIDPIWERIFNNCIIRWMPMDTLAVNVFAPSPIYLYLKSRRAS